MNIKRSCAAAIAPVLLWVLQGCAVLDPIVPPILKPPAPDASAAAAAPAGPVAFNTEIEAPDDIRTLLRRYLDLSRLSALTRGERLDEGELQRLVEAAPAQVLQLLQTEGFFSAQAEVRLLPAVAGEPRTVSVRVRAGEQARVSELNLEFTGPLAETAKLRGAETSGGRASDGANAKVIEEGTDARELLSDARRGFALKPGQAFRNAAWADAKTALLQRLRAGAYAAATYTSTQAEVDAATGRVKLSMLVDSGPLFRTGEIVIEGLKHQERDTVLNMTGFSKGAPLTESLLLDFQERLQRSGLFAGVTTNFDADAGKASSATLTVRVAEQVRRQLILGIGFSDTSGPRAQAEWIDRRLFGRSATTKQALEVGRERQDWRGEVSTHPGPRMWRNFVGAEVERQRSDVDILLSQSLRLGRTQDRQRIERSVFIEVERGSREIDGPIRLARSRTQALSLNASGIWRDLDNPILPTEGLVLSLQLGGGIARGDGLSGNFTRAYARLTGYYPLGSQFYAQGRLELGRVFAGDSTPVPDSQRFRAGGDDSVRGYAYRSLGPQRNGVLDSGRVVFTGSLEVARPIMPTLPSVWGAVFVDAGNAADSFSDLKPAIGAGIGVRWRSPIGPLRGDWAYGREVGKSRLHISLGIAF